MGPRTPLGQEEVLCPHLCRGPRWGPGVLPAQPGSLPAVRRGAGLPALGSLLAPEPTVPRRPRLASSAAGPLAQARLSVLGLPCVRDRVGLTFGHSQETQ